MFYNFNPSEAGFSDETWDAIPRTDKVIVRDWYLNGGNNDDTMLYGFYETDFSIRSAVNKYELRARPRIQISLAHFHLPFTGQFH